jgi:ABC-type Fe3+-hydroxamate transport system substrate-binding protein
MDMNRRSFIGLTGAAGMAVLTAQGSQLASAAPASGPVTIDHAFGQTTMPAPPKRVVSAGFTEQDDLLAVGVVPIATTAWWGDEPFEVWPWARPKLGNAQPTVLSIYSDAGFEFDRIAALNPDLIVATKQASIRTSTTACRQLRRQFRNRRVNRRSSNRGRCRRTPSAKRSSRPVRWRRWCLQRKEN